MWKTKTGRAQAAVCVCVPAYSTTHNKMLLQHLSTLRFFTDPGQTVSSPDSQFTRKKNEVPACQSCNRRIEDCSRVWCDHTSTRMHGATSQKTKVFVITSWNPQIFKVLKYSLEQHRENSHYIDASKIYLESYFTRYSSFYIKCV